MSELIDRLEAAAQKEDRANARHRGNGMIESAALARTRAAAFREAAEIAHEWELEQSLEGKEAGNE